MEWITAGSEGTEVMTDIIVEILKDNTIFAVAFTAWAYVVWYYGRKISGDLQSLSERLQQFHLKTSNRITKIEGHLEEKSDFHPYRNGNI